MKCKTCVDDAFPVDFYNLNRKGTWGYICLEGRAVNESAKFEKNPGLEDADSDSSPLIY